MTYSWSLFLLKSLDISRDLRLPVNQSGNRVFYDNIKLTIIQNGSYDEFAAKLSTEYDDDCGVTFGKVTKLSV